MAKNKDTAVTPPAGDFDYSAFMPEGMSTKDLRATGGLTPIYAPEEALDNGFPPCGGWLDRFEILPEVKVGKEIYIPKMIRVVCTNDTKGVQGTKDVREVTKVEKGKDVLIPLTGNLSNNKDLLLAVSDPNNVHWAIFRVRGTKETGQITPMWDWDVQLHSATKKRDGRFAIPLGGTRIDAPSLTQAPNGETYNKVTGEVVESLVSAPPAS